MKIQKFSQRTLLATGLALVAAACNPSSSDSQVSAAPAQPPAQPVSAKHEPTAERAMARSRERWAKVAAADWIAAYDFQAPEAKHALPLAQYLGQVTIHKYENPRVLEVLSLTKDIAYVQVRVLWTPQHPQLQKVHLEPGQTLTQEVDMTEDWRFIDGDWMFLRAQRAADFFEEHPEFLKKDGNSAAAGSDAKQGGSSIPK